MAFGSCRAVYPLCHSGYASSHIARSPILVNALGSLLKVLSLIRSCTLSQTLRTCSIPSDGLLLKWCLHPSHRGFKSCSWPINKKSINIAYEGTLVYNSLYNFADRGTQQVISCAIAGGWTQTTGYTAAFLHCTKLWQERWGRA